MNHVSCDRTTDDSSTHHQNIHLVMFNTLMKMMSHHRELVLVFYGDLSEHHKTYRPILRLLRAPGRLVRATAVRALLEKAERPGLSRVRAHCSGSSS